MSYIVVERPYGWTQSLRGTRAFSTERGAVDSAKHQAKTRDAGTVVAVVNEQTGEVVAAYRSGRARTAERLTRITHGMT